MSNFKQGGKILAEISQLKVWLVSIAVPPGKSPPDHFDIVVQLSTDVTTCMLNFKQGD